MKEPEPAAYVFGPFRLEWAKRRLWKDSKIVPLTPKALEILLTLVRQAGRAVDKDELMRAVWPDTFVGEETLTQNISTLRKVLGDTPDQPEYIATVPRRGYQFISPVTEAASSQPTAADAATGTSSAAKRIDSADTRSRRLRFGLALGVFLIGGVVIGFRYVSRPTDAHPEELWPVIPPAGTSLASAGTLSPDGQLVAFVTTDQRGVR